jgi:hypothetical protein
MIDFQSPTSGLWLCPLGTFENSPAIYGWVRRPPKNQKSRRDDRNPLQPYWSKISCSGFHIHLCAFASLREKSVFIRGLKPIFAKRTQIENRKALQINWMRKTGLASLPKRTQFLTPVERF